MDPQTVAFTPQNDIWRIQADMLRVQQTQADHAERLLRLEKRQEEDVRIKNLWGTSSPFPGVLSGTPQQGEQKKKRNCKMTKDRSEKRARLRMERINENKGPVNRPPGDAFEGFDDQSTNLIGSLQLDADDEPRRIGASSRANSVRFDETANQGHWSHAPRSSIDIIPRTGSSLSAHPMIERTYSHKSDGRQSSAGVSVHSATSGRANSLGIDTPFSTLGQASPLDTPGLAPGLFMLGPVPSIIRCWLTTNFRHGSMLYAAVCSGSYGSYLDRRLLDSLDLGRFVRQDGDTTRLKLPIYLPEAVTRGRSACSRSSSPAPQLPTLTVDFTVVGKDLDGDEKAIQVFIGSDVLRRHNADVLFSSNSITMYDDDNVKISIPMVRPEDEHAFKSLFIASSSLKALEVGKTTHPLAREETPLEGLAQSEPSRLTTKSPSSAKPSPQIEPNEKRDADSVLQDEPLPNAGRQSFEQRPTLVAINTSADTKSTEPTPATARPGTSPGIWGNWRRDSSEKPAQGSAGGEWAKAGSTYQRRETGIKVLKPGKPATRAFSSTQSSSSSPATGQSRFFDDGKRRSSLDGASAPETLKRVVSDTKSTTSATSASAKENGMTRPSNPIGSASAFAWMNK